MIKTTSLLLIMAGLFLLLMIGCSGNASSPISPERPQDERPSVNTEPEGKVHELLGVYTMKFDLDSMTATVEPDRDVLFHLNVKPYIPAPTIKIISWDPVNEAISVDVTVRNPYNVTGYDVRLIIYTDNIGHTLINDDNWTSLYDIAGGMNFNPFKAYAIKETKRQFVAYYSEKVRLLIRLPGGNPYVKFAIDASYPGNCVEPYEILNFTQGELFDKKNSTAPVSFYVNRWDPLATLSAWIECPDIFGSVIMQMPPPGGNHFQGNIVNYEGADAGEHMGWIKSKTNYSDLYLYEVIKIDVHVYPDSGWVVQQYETNASCVETDLLENIYITTGLSLSLKKYDDTSVLQWTRDLDSEDAYSSLKDLNFNGYLYVAGENGFCGTQVGNPGFTGGMYGTSNTRYWVNDDCMSGVEPGSCIAGSNQGISFLGTSVFRGTLDSIILKHDELGYELWRKEFVSPEGGLGFSDLTMGELGSFYATGAFVGTNVDFDPMVSVQNRTAGGLYDAFLAQYTSDGYYMNVVTWGGDTHTMEEWDEVHPTGMVIDDSGCIFISGTFYGEVDFDPGPLSMVFDSGEGISIFVSKFDSDFNFISAIQLGNAYSMSGASIAVDPNGNVYIAGTFEGNVDFDPGFEPHFKNSNGLTDIFLLKLTNDLEYVWAQTWGSTGEDSGMDVACNKNTGAAYLVGCFSGIVDFNPGDGVYERTAVTTPDSFLVKVLPNGYWEN